MVLAFDRQTLNVTAPAADGTRIVVQDVYNQIRRWQALPANMDEPNFMEASGKQSLSLSNVVGITMAFSKNWMIGVEAGAGPATKSYSVVGGNLTAKHLPTGAATSASVPGTTLIDTAARFVRGAIQTGDAVTNVTDGSTATVVDVVSETEVTTTALTGGGTNQWGIGDTWTIVATHPVFPTAFVHITISQDAAPIAITGLDQIDILRKIFLNKAVTNPDTPSLGQKRIDFYDDDQATIVDSITISADGNTRTNP